MWSWEQVSTASTSSATLTRSPQQVHFSNRRESNTFSLEKRRETSLPFPEMRGPCTSVMAGFLFHMPGGSGVMVPPSWWGLCIVSQRPSNVWGVVCCLDSRFLLASGECATWNMWQSVSSPGPFTVSLQHPRSPGDTLPLLQPDWNLGGVKAPVP